MKILAVHQGGELYGSDRCFAQSVAAFRRAWPEAEIHVLLGSDGPLRHFIGKTANTITISPLWIARRSAAYRTLLAMPRFLLSLPKIMWQMRNYDLVYVNTIVILDYVLPTIFFRSRTILHVHEITPSTKLGRLLRAAVQKSRAARIFNSEATANAFKLINSPRTAIVLNGVNGPEAAVPDVESETLNMALIGRINEWKGQDLALQALSMLPSETLDRIHLRLIGSAFTGQERLQSDLEDDIKRMNLTNAVTLVPFQPDIEQEYIQASIVLVPSRRPEPFGRVAIEAMSYGRPVLAADHGGLSEIIEHLQSGLLVAPNDASAWADAISYMVGNPEEVLRLGEGARKRFEENFTEEAMERSLIEAVKSFDLIGDQWR